MVELLIPAFVALNVVANKEVAVAWVKVAAAAVRLVVARLVEVVLVPVPLVQIMPPTEAVAAEKPFKIATDEALRYWTFAVPVTFKSEVVTPPKKVTVEVAVPPRAVTDASVSDEARQLVPFARQTFWPATKSCEEETSVAAKFVAVAFVKVAFVPVRPDEIRLVVVTVPKLPFQRRTGVPSENVRSVVGVKLDETVPETVSVEVTVALLVEKPPRSVSVAVATAPRFVTMAKVSVE